MKSKHNVSLDIFVSDTSVAIAPETFIYLSGNNILATTDTPFFGSVFALFVIEVDKKWVPAISGRNLMIKSKLSPQSGSHSSLEPHQLKPVREKGP